MTGPTLPRDVLDDKTGQRKLTPEPKTDAAPKREGKVDRRG